jgi:alpha-maltose-1-phosphate synthase
MSSQTPQFVVATPARSVCDDYARALQKEKLLRFIALGTRRGTAGIPHERTRLRPWIGLKAYIAAKLLPRFSAESFRFKLLPEFDRWVRSQLSPGDHIISSYGYANECFKWIRAHGGQTFIDAGNSHPANFWEILSEEHARWQSNEPPVARHWIDRSLSMMEDVDFVLSPSTYVTNSFLARGFEPRRILKTVYPVDLALFAPRTRPRPRNHPLTVISTSSLSLRKGTPYLLEAFRMVRKSIPKARLLLTQIVEESVKDILPKYADLEIDWSRSLSHPLLAERLRSADIFVLPSLEEGLARTPLEALACGLPIVVTSHTGANDAVTPGVNGEVVPIRDASAIAQAILVWRDKVLSPSWGPRPLLDSRRFSFECFEQDFLKRIMQLY